MICKPHSDKCSCCVW